MKTSKISLNKRDSAQRKIILEELKKVFFHPTAKQIYGLVLKKCPSIGLATVYRNLDYLEKNGLIIKLQTKDKESRYDGNKESHCHIFCKKCNKIEDIFDIKDVKIISKSLKKSKFKIEYNFLELHGLCKKCL